jgi:hypothetical protein
MKAHKASMRGMPILARWGCTGAMSAGVTGLIVGLVVGLFVYAPTAPFAAVELGIPAALMGGVVGVAAGIVVKMGRSIRRHGAKSS